MEEVLAKLREAEDLLIHTIASGDKSRENSICLTELQTAIMWGDAGLKKSKENSKG